MASAKQKDIRQSRKRAMLMAMYTFCVAYILLIGAVIVMLFCGVEKAELLIALIASIGAMISMPIGFYFGQNLNKPTKIDTHYEGGKGE